MNIKKQFGVDKESAENGKWFDIPEGGRLKVARLGNSKFTAEVQRLQKPHLGVLRSGLNNGPLIDSITVQAMAKTILLGWEGLDIDGEPVEYSQESAERLMTEYPEFRELVSQLSVSRENFALEDVAKK